MKLRTLKQATEQAQALANEEGREYYVVADCGERYSALPFRPNWGKVRALIGPRNKVAPTLATLLPAEVMP